MRKEIDLRQAINAISDVVQNRPRPVRQFDQIYMKTGDMVLQSEFVAAWADEQRLAFIGDGDAISICVAYLKVRGIVDYDFDERVVQAVKRFADKERLDHLDAVLYNCLDAFPEPSRFDCFYTNPPWGASNNGESVCVFTERGMEATGYSGKGLVVIADDEELDWPKQVLASTQSFALARGHCVSRLMPKMHGYHLDDDPELKSCNLEVAALPKAECPFSTRAITEPERLQNFYGRSKEPRVRYIREKKRLDYGNANENEYVSNRILGALLQ
jgi:predicted methyltransferase